MIRVAFDLRRPALVAFDEQPGRDAAERHRRREEERLAGDELFGLPDVGDDLFRRLARARTETRSASDAPISFRNVRRSTGSAMARPATEIRCAAAPERRIVGQLVERRARIAVVR